MKHTRFWIVALLAGLALGLPRDVPLIAPLQCLGIAGYGWCLSQCRHRSQAAAMGAVAGLSEVVGIFMLTHVHMPALAVLGPSILLLRILMAWATLSWRQAPLTVACGWTLLEYGYTLLLPLFGTATYLTMPWSAYPTLIQHEAILGMLGSVFGVVWIGMALAGLMASETRYRAITHLSVAMMLFGALGWTARRIREDAGRWQVAVCCGPADRGPHAYLKPDDFLAYYGPLAHQITPSTFPRLLVTPEVGLNAVDSDARPIQQLAHEAGIHWVVGCFNEETNANQAWIFHPEGQAPGEYVKTHWVPFMERYDRRGTGHPSVFGRLGVLICQDDNFTDLARGNAKAGARLLAIPTYDWAGVETVHLHNMRHRALETGCVLARAAHDGTSAIVAPDGRLLASTRGEALIQAEVSLQKHPAPYTRWHDWPMLMACLAGMGIWLARRGHQKTRK